MEVLFCFILFFTWVIFASFFQVINKKCPHLIYRLLHTRHDNKDFMLPFSFSHSAVCVYELCFTKEENMPRVIQLVRKEAITFTSGAVVKLVHLAQNAL